MSIHLLVITAFVGPRPKNMVCCHNDGNARNNTVENLRWDTAKANTQDDYRNGIRHFGSRSPNAKLLESDITQMRELFAAGANVFSLAEQFGIDHTNVYLIAKGKTWQQVSGPITPNRRSHSDRLTL